MRETQQKRYQEFQIGDRFFESEGFPESVVVSRAECPVSKTRAYLLVRSDDARWTIYQCLRDARCEPVVARMIPQEVMKQFLFDAFIGCLLPDRILPDAPQSRCPVESIPEYTEPKQKKKLKPKML